MDGRRADESLGRFPASPCARHGRTRPPFGMSASWWRASGCHQRFESGEWAIEKPLWRRPIPSPDPARRPWGSARLSAPCGSQLVLRLALKRGRHATARWGATRASRGPRRHRSGVLAPERASRVAHSREARRGRHERRLVNSYLLRASQRPVINRVIVESAMSQAFAADAARARMPSAAIR